MKERKECVRCGVHTARLACGNCGSTRLKVVAPGPADGPRKYLHMPAAVSSPLLRL